MSRTRLIRVIFFVMLFCSVLQVRALSSYDNVLFITSYDNSFPTVPMQVAGLKSVLNLDSVSVDVEEMDCKRFPQDENVASFGERLSFKLKNLPYRYDVAVLADDNALLFGLSEQHGMLDSIPMVFLGVNNMHLALEQNKNPQVTGVTETLGMSGTIEVMKKLFPDSPRVIAISDGTVTGRSDSMSFSSAATLAWADYEILDLRVLSFDGLAEKLRGIPEDVPVLLISAYTDCRGVTKTFSESLKLITSNLRAPLFHLWPHGLGKGVFGGDMVSQYEQGRLAGMMVSQILGGRDVASINVQNDNESKYMFDYNELSRFGVDESILPEGSEIVNKPHSVLWINRSYMPYVVSCCIVLVMLVLFVIISSARKRRLKKYLRITNQTINALNEELVRSKEETDRRNSYKGLFIENLARELKAPLNVIDDFSEIIAEPGLKPDEVAGYGKVIILSARKIKQVIGDITDFSNIYSTGARLSVSDICLNDLLRDIFADFKIIAGEKNVALSLELPLKDEDSHIVSDRERIAKILDHLLDNALKYTAQGKICMRYRVDEIKRQIFISVSDTGIGIPQKRRMILSEIFSNNSGDILDMHEKVGLGLTIAQKNAVLIQGQLSFESTEGVGSVFTLSIPMKISDELSKSAAVIADPSYPVVLIVEAESTSFLYLKVLMERLSMSLRIIHARTGEEAVTDCQTKRVDMVLAGVNVASDDGLKIISEIRKAVPLVPIVAVLPSDSKSEVDDAIAAGANDYLVKPVNRDGLMARCRKYLSKFSAFSSK